MLILDDIQKLADLMLDYAQIIYVQQVQTLTEGDWDRTTDIAWSKLSLAHRELTERVNALRVKSPER